MTEEMKSSEVEWLGRIPAEWSIDRVKFHYNNSKQIVGTKADNYGRLALTLNGVVKRPKDDADGLQPDDFSGYQILESGDLVFKLIDLQNVSTSRVGLAHDKGIVSPAYIRLVSKNGNSSRFGEYYFLSMWQREIFNQLGDAGVRSNLSSSDLLNLPYVDVPFSEQEMVADFLDEKCAEIDKLSEDIQKQIDILEEYKRSVITRAVTKGIDANAGMKKSDMDWVGLIPNNWRVEKIKYHLSRDEKRNPGDEQVLSVYREYGVIPKDSRDDNYNVTSEDTSKYKYVKPNQLVINKMKAWQGSMGVSEYKGVVSPAYFIYSIFDAQIRPRYIHYLLRSCYRDEFRRISGGIREGQWDLPATGFENTNICIPPLEEQDRILDFIESIVPKIDESVLAKQEQLNTLFGYKKSIIYEYVTGKKRVKGAK